MNYFGNVMLFYSIDEKAFEKAASIALTVTAMTHGEGHPTFIVVGARPNLEKDDLSVAAHALEIQDLYFERVELSINYVGHSFDGFSVVSKDDAKGFIASILN